MKIVGKTLTISFCTERLLLGRASGEKKAYVASQNEEEEKEDVTQVDPVACTKPETFLSLPFLPISHHFSSLSSCAECAR